MTPIPEAAMPVVEILRRDVPRPKSLPASLWEEEGGDELRWGKYCPMGLHDKSTSSVPCDEKDFADGECDQDAVDAFAGWWDGITDEYAWEALDAIWGKAP